MAYFVHASSFVDEGASIGDGSRIWHFSHIMTEALIGNRCNIGQNVFIASRVKIGNNVKIQNNVSLYEGTVLEDDVFCGPSAVFTNVKTPRAAVPRNTSADYLPTIIRRGASIGANATIVCGKQIGRYAMIAAGAVVTRHVMDYALVAGVPARQIGWVCECGLQLDHSEDHIYACACGEQYLLMDDPIGRRLVVMKENPPMSSYG